MRSDVELIVVFKKDIAEENAEKLIKSFQIPYRKGMDSGRGKIYFYSTGPKYILTFQEEEHRLAFESKHYEFLPENHEIYQPDWDIIKD